MTSADTTDTGALTDLIRGARAQHQAGGGSVLDILLRNGADPALLGDELARSGIAVLADDAVVEPDFSVWDLAQARQHRCVVLRTVGAEVFCAAEDPWNELTLQRVARRLREQPMPVAARRGALTVWLGEGQKGAVDGAGSPRAPADGPVVQFVDQALHAAFKTGASDVHFETDRDGVTVKHRLDGVLVRFARLDGSLAGQEAISRIKVLGQLDITERRLPQDGRFRLTAPGIDLDLRVSIMPSVHGEDAVLRLLDKAQLRGSHEAVTLDRLGFAATEAGLIRQLAARPSGMLLVTGPTGSGKTTTVYAALSEINTGFEKIVTIEDPVEYELAGVLQIPVNERKGLTFARGLRSILRHDPDRILVGEIRDAETAEIAVQSALTGHTVFTTVHANSVGDVVGRFRHFGLDMFGFMSALNGVVVQRLLRRLCPACARRAPLAELGRQWLARQGKTLSETMGPRGCAACRGTGYRGRFVVAELHEIDDGFRDLVTEAAPLSALKAHAANAGVKPLVAQALELVLEGRTSVEEVWRVVGV